MKLARLGVMFQGFLDRFRRNTRYAKTALLLRIGLAIIYLIVFIGLLPQILTLIGSKGVLPIAGFIEGTPRLYYENFPTLHLFWHTDAAIIVLIVIGIIASIMMLVGVFPRISLLACMLIYLSYVVSGRDFFFFQWDNLLLEASFLALFLPMSSFWKKEVREPSPVLVFLFRWLVFRIYFESAIAKIVYGQGTWLNLTAMQYYYETSPLPSFGGWFVQQWFPTSFHQATVLLVLLVEGLVVFLLFYPRKARIWSFYIFAGFNLVIMFTSNYGFFNPLSIVVALLLLDDEHIMQWRWLAERFKGLSVKHASRLAIAVSLVLAVLVVPLSIIEFEPLVANTSNIPLISSIQDSYHPFRIINSYHLFPDIVKERVVAVIVASDDNSTWKEYEFKHTPQAVDKMPPWLPLYQDRFAFQYSFLSLGQLNNDYFMNTIQKLCSSSQDVSGLLAVNPYPQGPKYVRIDLYNYSFSTPDELVKAGVWWDREYRASTNVIQC